MGLSHEYHLCTKRGGGVLTFDKVTAPGTTLPSSCCTHRNARPVGDPGSHTGKMQGLVNRAGDDDTARICRVGVRILQRNEAGEEQTDSGFLFFF